VRVLNGQLGPVHIGTTTDGRNVIARGSADGRPTIEIQRAGGGRITHKFRYGEK
jgi:hypothetical protein